MHSNEEYLVHVGLGDSDEAYTRCLTIMQSYGENRWWLSDQASTRAYYQTHEIRTSGVLLLPNVICYQMDLFTLLKRPVFSYEFVTDEFFDEVERAWQERTAIQAEPAEHAQEIAEEEPGSEQHTLYLLAAPETHKGLSRVKQPRTGAWPTPTPADEHAHRPSEPPPHAPTRIPRRDGARDQQEPLQPNGALRVPLPLESFAQMRACGATPFPPQDAPMPLLHVGAVLWTTQREEDDQRPFLLLEEWDGEPRPLHELHTPPLDLDARIFLVAHGCRVSETDDGVHITFPEGSTRTELYPRTLEGHFRLHLPDGTELREVQPRFRDTDRSFLRFPADISPASVSPQQTVFHHVREAAHEDGRDAIGGRDEIGSLPQHGHTSDVKQEERQ